MPSTVFGLPLHPLVVHATVVFVPLAALAVLVSALWPAARRRLGLGTQAVALLALVLVPLSTSTGENLEHSVPRSALVEQHAELADGLLPWMVALVVIAAGLWWLDRRDAQASAPSGSDAVTSSGRGVFVGRDRGSVALRVVAAVLAVVAAAGTTVQVIRIGDSGAKAAWHGVATSNQGGGEGDDG